MKNKNYIEKYFIDIKQIIEKLPKENIDKVIEILFNAWKNDNTVFVMGNGGSASTASHFAADLSKVTIVPNKKRFKAISLNDNITLMSAWINDEGFDNLFVGQLENFIKKDDVLIGISVHGGKGWSKNLIKAMKFAKEKQAINIGLAGFDGGEMKNVADECIIVPVESTPYVEALHSILTHLIAFDLKEKIKNE